MYCSLMMFLHGTRVNDSDETVEWCCMGLQGEDSGSRPTSAGEQEAKGQHLTSQGSVSKLVAAYSQQLLASAPDIQRPGSKSLRSASPAVSDPVPTQPAAMPADPHPEICALLTEPRTPFSLEDEMDSQRPLSPRDNGILEPFMGLDSEPGWTPDPTPPHTADEPFVAGGRSSGHPADPAYRGSGDGKQSSSHHAIPSQEVMQTWTGPSASAPMGSQAEPAHSGPDDDATAQPTLMATWPRPAGQAAAAGGTLRKPPLSISPRDAVAVAGRPGARRPGRQAASQAAAAALLHPPSRGPGPPTQQDGSSPPDKGSWLADGTGSSPQSRMAGLNGFLDRHRQQLQRVQASQLGQGGAGHSSVDWRAGSEDEREVGGDWAAALDEVNAEPETDAPSY